MAVFLRIPTSYSSPILQGQKQKQTTLRIHTGSNPSIGESKDSKGKKTGQKKSSKDWNFHFSTEFQGISELINSMLSFVENT